MLEHEPQADIGKSRRQVALLFLDKTELVAESVTEYVDSLGSARGATLLALTERTRTAIKRYIEIVRKATDKYLELDHELSIESDLIDQYKQIESSSYQAAFNKIVSEDLRRELSNNRALVMKTVFNSLAKQQQMLQDILNLYLARMIEGLQSMHVIHKESILERTAVAGIKTASSEGLDFIPIVGHALAAIVRFLQHLSEESPKQIMAEQIELWDVCLEDIKHEADKLDTFAVKLSQDIESSRVRQSNCQKAITSLKKT